MTTYNSWQKGHIASPQSWLHLKELTTSNKIYIVVRFNDVNVLNWLQL